MLLAGWHRSASQIDLGSVQISVLCALRWCADGATSSNGVALLLAAHGSNKQIFGADKQVPGRATNGCSALGCARDNISCHSPTHG